MSLSRNPRSQSLDSSRIFKLAVGVEIKLTLTLSSLSVLSTLLSPKVGKPTFSPHPKTEFTMVNYFLTSDFFSMQDVKLVGFTH